MKTLHLVESLEDWGPGRQLGYLASALQAHRPFEIVCLGREGRTAERFRQAGVAVHALNWTRPLDLFALRNLRAWLQQARPELIHVWRRAGLRALSCVAPELLARTVVYDPLPSLGRLAWWDHRILRRVRRVVVAGESDRARCEQLGLAPIEVVPPAIQSDVSKTSNSAQPQRIVCLGSLEKDRGFWDAIWTADMLLHLYPKASLAIAGMGIDHNRLANFTTILRRSNDIHFTGPIENPRAILQNAELCWVPSRASCGRQAVLEAMAAGCPVIAADVPCLREIIHDDETGLLVQSGDVVDLARHTHLLFEKPELRESLSRNAKAYARTHFDAVLIAQRWRDLYDRLAA